MKSSVGLMEGDFGSYFMAASPPARIDGRTRVGRAWRMFERRFAAWERRLGRMATPVELIRFGDRYPVTRVQ